MTTTEIANRLVELCKTGQNHVAYQELFAEDAIAIEPDSAPVKQTQGLSNLLAKMEVFRGMIKEFHGSGISEPLVAGNFFSLTMWMETTSQDGNRSKMEEVCVYEVKDGKIVKEIFFF
jgi:hypothetical protein